MWLKAEKKRFRKCLDTTDKTFAIWIADGPRYIPRIAIQGLAFDTIRVEIYYIRGLVAKVGMKMGSRLVLELNIHAPKHKRSRRVETFTPIV